jgi:hypothetical protein
VVRDGDNSLYFESPAGAVSIQTTTGAVCSIGTTSLAAPAVGANYSQQLLAVGCEAPVSWKLTAGALCSGLTLDAAAGTITGVPLQRQSCTFTVEAKDNAGNSASQDYTVAVAGRPGVSMSKQMSCSGCVW